MNTPFERAYLAIGRAIRMMGHPIELAQTPAERVSTLTQLLPDTALPATVSLFDYQSDPYSPYPGDLESVHLGIRTIQRIAFKAFISRIFKTRGKAWSR